MLMGGGAKSYGVVLAISAPGYVLNDLTADDQRPGSPPIAGDEPRLLSPVSVVRERPSPRGSLSRVRPDDRLRVRRRDGKRRANPTVADEIGHHGDRRVERDAEQSADDAEPGERGSAEDAEPGDHGW